MKYSVECKVYLSIDSEYPDGVGEAQREVEWYIEQLKNVAARGPDGSTCEIARATDIKILDGDLREEPGESVNKLFYGEVCLDEGFR